MDTSDVKWVPVVPYTILPHIKWRVKESNKEKYPKLTQNSNKLINQLRDELQSYTSALDEDMQVAMFLNPVMISLGYPLLGAYARHEDIDFIDVDLFHDA